MIKILHSSEIERYIYNGSYYDYQECRYKYLQTFTEIPYQDSEPKHYLLVQNNIDFHNAAGIKFTSLNSGDKVIFYKSVFPSLLLGRIKTDIKRTNKISSNVKIVTNTREIGMNCYMNVGVWDEESHTLYKHQGYKYRYDSFNIYDCAHDSEREELAKETNIEPCFLIPMNEAQYEFIKLNMDYYRNFIHTDDLIKYCWNTMEKISDDDFNGILDLIDSSDKKNQTLGVQTLQYFNFSDRIYDLMKCVVQRDILDPKYRDNNTAWKYVAYILRQGPSIRSYDYMNYLCDTYKAVYRHKFISDKLKMELKDKIKESLLERILSDDHIKRDLDLIGCELAINDKVGETESGD